MSDVRQYLLHARSRAHARRRDEARRVLTEGAERGSILVASSWGKDSIALADLAVEVYGRPTILHLASPYALPGYEATVAHFTAMADVHSEPAARTLEEYIAWCSEIGLPHERTRSAQSKVVKSIKTSRGAAYAAAHSFAGQALGMRAEEGGPRRPVLRSRGSIYQRAGGDWMVCPLAWWSALDVWAHILSRGLPYNRRVYDAETHGFTRCTIRNTGWLSTDGAHDGRLVWLRYHFPEQFEDLAKAFPRIRAFA